MRRYQVKQAEAMLYGFKRKHLIWFWKFWMALKIAFAIFVLYVITHN